MNDNTPHHDRLVQLRNGHVLDPAAVCAIFPCRNREPHRANGREYHAFVLIGLYNGMRLRVPCVTWADATNCRDFIRSLANERGAKPEIINGLDVSDFHGASAEDRP